MHKHDVINHLGRRLLGLGLPPPEAAPPDASTRLPPPPLTPPPLLASPSLDAVPFGLGNLDLALILPAPFVLKGSLALGFLAGLQSGWRRSSGFTTPLDRCCGDLDVVAIVVVAVLAPPAVTRGFLQGGVLTLRFLSSPYLVIALVVPVELRGSAITECQAEAYVRGKCLYARAVFGVVVHV